MKENSGRLVLKVKKKRNSIPSIESKVQKNNLLKDKENITPNLCGKKRGNPFGTSVLVNKKINCQKDGNDRLKNRDVFNDRNENLSLINKLDHAESKASSAVLPRLEPWKDKCVKPVINNVKADSELNKESKYTKKCVLQYPLDWRIKQKLKLISAQPFSSISNIKSSDGPHGIRSFLANIDDENFFQKHIYNWIYPNIPAVPSFPLKKKITGGPVKEESINVLANNVEFQNFVMKEWRNSFESIFSMLKCGYSPYFYLCSHQMTILFKAASIVGSNMVAIVTPTTKGFRKMISNEGISFTLPHEKAVHRKSLEERTLGCDSEVSEEELNTSNEEDFLCSIGLDKNYHFPHMLEQERLQEKSKTKLLDNRVESTIVIENCVGFFNFLLNSSLLVPSSGSMMGIPPTLISPSPFEGSSLQKCKFVNGPIKLQVDGYATTKYCLDVSGVILPTQVAGIIQSIDSKSHHDLSIHSKPFDKLEGLNLDGKAADGRFGEKQLHQLGVNRAMATYLAQESTGDIPIHDEVKYSNGDFTYFV